MLEAVVPEPDAPWSNRALWACMDFLRLGTGATAEVRVEWAWTDGARAFCIVYNPPYQPGKRVGLRRQIHDTDPDDYEPDIGPRYAALLAPMFADVGADGEWDPIGFGRIVAQ